MRLSASFITSLAILVLAQGTTGVASSKSNRGKRGSRGSGGSNGDVVVSDNRETAAVLQSSNTTLQVFIGISSRAVPHAAPMRSLQRQTWLAWAANDDRVTYQYFVNLEGPTSRSAVADEDDVAIVPAAKIAHCPKGNSRPAHNCRSGALVRFLLLWGLRRTPAQFIVATEHDGFVCLPQLLLETSTWSLSSHVAHYAGDCDTKKENIFNPEQTFDVFGRNVLVRIFQLISDSEGSSFYIPSITFAQNMQPILRFLNHRREIDIVPDLDRIIVGIAVKQNRPSPLTNLCAVGHLYFHFRESMNRMGTWSHEMKTTFDRYGNRKNSSLAKLAYATNVARQARRMCTDNSCPLPPNSQAWWCCPFYGKQLKAAADLSRQRESCRGVLGRQ